MTVATIIIPTRNRDSTLALAANSALSQSISDIEVIVVNDDCTDQTDEVLALLQASDDRLRVLNLPQALGLSGGLQRNEAIKAARGEFICYLDDDDVMTYRSVEARVNFLREHEDVDFCWARTMFIRNNVNHPEFDDMVMARLVAVPDDKIHWAIGTVIPNDLMHRAGVVGESGIWWVSGRGEDRKLVAAIMEAGFKGAPVDAVVSIYGRSAPFVESKKLHAKSMKARRDAVEAKRLRDAGTPSHRRAVLAPTKLPGNYSERLQAQGSARGE